VVNGPRFRVRPSGRRRGEGAAASVTEGGGGRISDRFGLLLLLLVGAFIAQGLGTALWARVVTSALEFCALVVAFYSTGVLSGPPSITALGLCGVIAFGASTVQASAGAPFAISSIVGVGVVFAMLASVLLRVLRHKRVNTQTLYGAVCAYLLLGFLFADLYGAFDALGAHALFGEPVSRAVYSYFSFVTLTTVGFGDYTVRSDLARRFVDLEAVLGQVFIATTLARLVALYRGPEANRSDKGMRASADPPEAQPSGTGGRPPDATEVEADHRVDP
jgi:hypothetical protein